MKAILVIDMPKNCAECRIRLSGEPNEWCWYIKHGLDDIKTKPSWCPLKPLPEAKENKPIPKGQTHYQWVKNKHEIIGWNNCLKEIEK